MTGSLSSMCAAICDEYAPKGQEMKYRPILKGMIFMERWCDRCSKASGCEIPSRTMIYSVSDDEYPSEWVGPWNNAKCTAFESKGADQ